jgi:hypothetical protein
MNHWVRTILEDACSKEEPIPDHVHAGLKRIVQLIDSADVHAFRTTELEQIADDLSECTSLNELANLMWKTATSTGFQHFAIFVLAQGSSGTFRSRVCTSYSEAWIRRYQEMAYQFVDPVISEATRRNDWFLFSDLDDSVPGQNQFWEDAKEHGIGRNGVCFITVRPDGARIAVVFSTSHSIDKTNHLLSLNGLDLKFLAELAVESFYYSSMGPILPDDILSPHELRFLFTLATSSEPVSALEITSSYGSNISLQASIRQKLNVKTIFQALAIASVRGWFNRLPYDADEVTRSFPRLEGLNFHALAFDGNDEHVEHLSNRPTFPK